MWSWPKAKLDGPDQAQRLPNFINSNLQPPQHIAFLVDRHAKRDSVICGIWMVAPDVPVHPRRTAGYTHDSQISRFVRMKNASLCEPVASRVGGFDDPHQIDEFPFEVVQHLDARVSLVYRPIRANSTRTSHSPQQPAAAQLFVQTKNHLPQARSMRVGDDETHVGCDGAYVGDVVVDAL